MKKLISTVHCTMYILYKSAESENMKIKLILYIVSIQECRKWKYEKKVNTIHCTYYTVLNNVHMCNTVVQKGKYENKSEMNKYKSGDSKNLNKMNRC